MSALKSELERRLTSLDDVTLGYWKDSALLCVHYRGKEFAHFHGEDTLDIRLTTKFIRSEGLTRAASARLHPNRSANSRWICVEFKTQDDLDVMMRLAQVACAELGV